MSSDLSEDLIGEIFERLPPKFLVRFRCLSKSWYSRISSSDFMRRHHLRSLQTSPRQKVLIRQQQRLDSEDGLRDLYALHSVDRFALCHGPGCFDLSKVEFPCNRPKFVNSCNGIICLRDYKIGISLWNPSIRRRLTLPNQPPHSTINGYNAHVVVGFGIDPVTNNYKIVRISCIKYKGIVGSSMVYSMKTRTWSSIASPTTRVDYLKSRACFLNGSLHWVAVRYLPRSFDFYIMTFNLSTHAFGKINFPGNFWTVRQPTIVNGCLAVIAYESDVTCSIWAMKEYNNVTSWNVLFKVTTDRVDGQMKGIMQVTTNTCFLINNYRDGLEFYDPATGVRFVLFKTKFYKVYMETYIESLELLDGGVFES